MSADGTLQTVPTWTAHAGYQHWWSDTLRSTATYGLIVVGRTQSLDDDDPRMLQSGTVNLVWSPVAMVDLGAEIVIGARETQSGEQADASRLPFLGRFRFDRACSHQTSEWSEPGQLIRYMLGWCKGMRVR